MDHWKNRFPAFKAALKDWIYVDNASTTQKAGSVIEAIDNYELNGSANIHRGLYPLSTHTTLQYEGVRKKVQQFLGANQPAEIAFTSGTTESINIIANSYADIINESDEILISAMEHHADLIPWQVLCETKKATLKILPIDKTGELNIEGLKNYISNRTKLVALTHVSNVLGTINPIKSIIDLAHQQNIPVLLDGAQSIGHMPFNVDELNVDFLAFSAHKMFGPSGTGILYVNRKHHHLVKPLRYGGGAIKKVTYQKTSYREFPFCVEAGTPNISGVVGLGAAVDFVQEVGLEKARLHARELASLLIQKLNELSFIKILSNQNESLGIVSFNVDGIHAHDVASYLADHKIAVRAGHHCAQPLHDYFEIPASVRVSFSIYNNASEVEAIIIALKKLKSFWG